jgi:hypothetical protein
MRSIAAAAATLLLGGCYELERPVFKEGQRAPIAGTFECKGLMNTRRDTIRETSTGVFWKDYQYVNAANETLTLKAVQGTLYAAQVQSKGIYVAYLDVQSPQRFLILVPDLLSNSRPIDDLANSLGIRSSASATQKDFITLHGTEETIAAFITRHTANLLTTVMDCSRISS